MEKMLNDENISNDQVVALPIFFGLRRFDGSDLDEFQFNNPFKIFYSFIVYPFFSNDRNHFFETFNEMKECIDKRIKQDKAPIAVFFILRSWEAWEAKEWIAYLNEIRLMRKNIFVYPIVWGGHFCSDPKDSGNTEYIHHSNQAAWLYYDEDAPSSGARRVCEYMSRIMGYDLDSGLFPVYDIETARKIADHINNENFNAWRAKKGSVPKYPVRDGKPYFPIISVEVECPKCNKKKYIKRTMLDEKGGVATECFYPEQHKVYLENISKLFDPWPEFEKNKQKIKA